MRDVPGDEVGAAKDPQRDVTAEDVVSGDLLTGADEATDRETW